MITKHWEENTISELFQLQVFIKHSHHGKQSSVTPQIAQCGILVYHNHEIFFFFCHSTSTVQLFGDDGIDLWYFVRNKYCSLTKQKEILRTKNKQMIRNNVFSAVFPHVNTDITLHICHILLNLYT